ncbi:hypothetical protein [Chitinophaga pinensis]|uniref:Uncharacterized protein n=1 Tax=Chitinophaga pinensis (strain ATCC 43595 / DSM 2588 / LMG 13176 / NBRC 15968 / NCIMB 11800 / UQM 2034) TaxID=485918 RepID=A0A979G5R6_CHIPD|nr:hypothetical protein [Chitinophaga pinensis]ACU61317.1 hypothetical protein Cpin_3855 [Chitinophaga pinensis DSM 2588]
MNYKPFDPERAKQGDPVILQEYPNDTSSYLATLIREPDSDPKVHVIKMTEPSGHQYIILVTDRGVAYGENGRNFHKAIVMAPKKVTYYFVSCQNEWGRYASQMSTVEADADNIAREWAKEPRMLGIQKHTIEIEE